MQETLTTVLTGRVIVDDQLFESCTFRNAQLVFTGGTPPILVNCRMENTQLAFEGAAHNTLRHLRAMAAGSPDFRAALAALLPELSSPSTPLPAND